MIRFLVLLFVGSLGLLAGCDDADEDMRARQASENEGVVRIAIVWDETLDGKFIEGVNLAISELNAGGGVLGRMVETVHYSDHHASDDKNIRGVEIGRSIAKDPQIVAVIGHSDVLTAIPASIIYEEFGILYINPTITDRSLNEHGFKYTFSTIPNNELVGNQIATQAFSRGFRRIGVLNSRSDQAFEITDAFVKQAAALGMEIVSRRSFFDQQENFRDVIAGFGFSGFDALFLAASSENTRAIVTQSMEMNFRTPTLLGSIEDPLLLQKDLGGKTPLLIMPILFDPYVKSPRTSGFLSVFQDTYKSLPDGFSAQGYDAVKMLAAAMTKAGSSVPLSVGTIIRYTLSWQGITGRHSFTQAGNVYAKTLDFATLRDGEIEFFSAEGGVLNLNATSDQAEAK